MLFNWAHSHKSQKVPVSFVKAVKYVSLAPTLDRFACNLILWTYMKTCPENPHLVKIRQNYWHFT
jgi:hypothetical protein